MTDTSNRRVQLGRRERKRQLLADQAAAIAFDLFEAQGYEAVTMEQIAAAADLAKGTLYKYFPVKEALLAHQFQRDIGAGLAPLWQVLEKQHTFAAQMQRLLHASAKWNEARRRYIPHYLRYRFSVGEFDGTSTTRQQPSRERQLFERLCLAGQHRGDVRDDLPAGQLAVMLDYMCLGALSIWLETPDGNLKNEFDALRVLALRGMRP